MPWAVSIMPVGQCARLIATLALTARDDDFRGVPELVKGDLVAWDELYSWLTASSSGEAPMGLPATTARRLAPCALGEWKAALTAVAAAPDAPENVTRLAMILESNARGIHVDAAWGSDLARAVVEY